MRICFWTSGQSKISVICFFNTKKQAMVNMMRFLYTNVQSRKGKGPYMHVMITHTGIDRAEISRLRVFVKTDDSTSVDALIQLRGPHE